MQEKFAPILEQQEKIQQLVEGVNIPKFEVSSQVSDAMRNITDNKDEIDNFKRRWRKMGLPSYMIRILVQVVQAYHRREYALTVSALSTLWEGIIQEKVNDNSYRVSRKTRENLTKLIEENEFDKIFSSFCEEFIFYDCRKVEEVKPDVPGRHGIAHCWYNTYPTRVY